jgi:regulator of RNase E activity RraA
MAIIWRDDNELFALIRRELYTAVIGDVMDKCKLRHQFLPQPIQPLVPEMFVVGRAMTVLVADIFDDDPKDPFGLMLTALDDLKPDEVYVCSGGSRNYALWGELMVTRAARCGAAGAVLDGFHRDTKGILAMGFPTFSRGSYAQDQGPRGKVIDFRVALEFGGVRITPGDFIVGDIDGVLVVPKEWEKEVFSLALEKARKEKTVKWDLEAGMTAVEAFKKYGIF